MVFRSAFAQLLAAPQFLSYQYDFLNRLTGEIYADGTQTEYQYDRAGNLRRHKNQNGALFIYRPDIRGRVTEEIVVNAPIEVVSEFQTTFRNFSYDGLNLVR